MLLHSAGCGDFSLTSQLVLAGSRGTQQKMSINIKDVCSLNVFLQLAATQHCIEGKHLKKKKSCEEKQSNQNSAAGHEIFLFIQFISITFVKRYLDLRWGFHSFQLQGQKNTFIQHYAAPQWDNDLYWFTTLWLLITSFEGNFVALISDPLWQPPP